MGNKVGTKKYKVLYLYNLTIMNVQILHGLDYTHTCFLLHVQKWTGTKNIKSINI
jgi:hypothetical protein